MHPSGLISIAKCPHGARTYCFSPNQHQRTLPSVYLSVNTTYRFWSPVFGGSNFLRWGPNNIEDCNGNVTDSDCKLNSHKTKPAKFRSQNRIWLRGPRFCHTIFWVAAQPLFTELVKSRVGVSLQTDLCILVITRDACVDLFLNGTRSKLRVWGER